MSEVILHTSARSSSGILQKKRENSSKRLQLILALREGISEYLLYTWSLGQWESIKQSIHSNEALLASLYSMQIACFVQPGSHSPETLGNSIIIMMISLFHNNQYHINYNIYILHCTILLQTLWFKYRNGRVTRKSWWPFSTRGYTVLMQCKVANACNLVYMYTMMALLHHYVLPDCCEVLGRHKQSVLKANATMIDLSSHM